MISRYTLAGLVATLACGAALAGEPSATAPGVQKAASGASHAKSTQKADVHASHAAIEEIVVQARAPEPIPVAPRPEIETPRFVPPPLTITVPRELTPPSSGKQERLADAGTESKL